MIPKAKSFVVRALARIGRDDVTGMAAMVAYNLAISLVPFAVLALWVAGWLVNSEEFESAVIRDLGAIFPGPGDATLTQLLQKIQSGAATTGIFALLLSIWTGMSFWGSIDTAFCRIYGLPSRGWVGQKRFSFAMLWLFILFIAATVAVPTTQSAIVGVQAELPFGLDRVPGVALVSSLVIGFAVLFLSLWAIFALGPSGRLPWRAVLPGAVFSSVAVFALDAVYPYYLANVSTVWRFGTTVVFLVIVLAWFYAVAIVLLFGAEINAALLRRHAAAVAEPDLGSEGEPARRSGRAAQASRSEAISRKQAT